MARIMASPPSGGAESGQPPLALIAAVARNGVIGADNTMPWHLPADLAHFRALTTGHAIVMGRMTWQSLGRPLPGRQSIVVSRNARFDAPGATVVGSLDAALRAATMPAPPFCIGGAALYAVALPRAHVLHLTEIDRDFAGDTVFPAWDRADFTQTARESHVTDEGLAYAFVTYVRTRPAAATA